MAAMAVLVMSTLSITSKQEAKMPSLSQVAAAIDDNRVVWVAALSSENDYSEWLESVRAEHDAVLLVTHANVGWKVTPEGLRPDKPDDTSWVWDEEGAFWNRPVDYPTDGGYYTWNESAQNWLPAESPEVDL